MEPIESEDESKLYELGAEKIANGKKLMEQLHEMKHIDGVAKIQRKISSEIASLEKVIDSSYMFMCFTKSVFYLHCK